MNRHPYGRFCRGDGLPEPLVVILFVADTDASEVSLSDEGKEGGQVGFEKIEMRHRATGMQLALSGGKFEA